MHARVHRLAYLDLLVHRLRSVLHVFITFAVSLSGPVLVALRKVDLCNVISRVRRSPRVNPAARGMFVVDPSTSHPPPLGIEIPASSIARDDNTYGLSGNPVAGPSSTSFIPFPKTIIC